MDNKKQDVLKEKFHPAMAEEQEKIDRQTDNPIDVSNAPEDGDHCDVLNENKNKD